MSHRTRRVMSGSFACVAMAVTLFVAATNAVATTCSTGYRYSGQQQDWQASPSGIGWGGISGELTIDSLSLPGSGADHILNLLELKNFETASCPQAPDGSSNCWLQDGYGIGGLPAPCGGSGGIKSYFELSDVNAYDCQWQSYGLRSPTFWNVYLSGVSGNLGRLDAYINTGSGPILLATAYLPDYGWELTATAVLESGTAVAGACPAVGNAQYFGANLGGGITVGTELKLSPDGVNWPAWTSTPGTWNDAPYNHRVQLGNYNAFSTYGS